MGGEASSVGVRWYLGGGCRGHFSFHSVYLNVVEQGHDPDLELGLEPSIQWD